MYLVETSIHNIHSLSDSKDYNDNNVIPSHQAIFFELSGFIPSLRGEITPDGSFFTYQKNILAAATIAKLPNVRLILPQNTVFSELKNLEKDAKIRILDYKAVEKDENDSNDRNLYLFYFNDELTDDQLEKFKAIYLTEMFPISGINNPIALHRIGIDGLYFFANFSGTHSVVANSFENLKQFSNRYNRVLSFQGRRF